MPDPRRPVTSVQRPGEDQAPALSQTDVERLTLFKWRYTLESTGFSPEQTGRLMFLRWLHTRRVRRGA